jgi:hypothetical protein
MQYINVVKILVLFTFVHFLFKFDKRKTVHRWVLAILTLSLANEILSSVFRYFEINIHFNSSIYTIVHTVLWLGLLGHISKRTKLTSNLAIAYLFFAVVNLMWIDGVRMYNVYSLILGALLYVLVFIYDSYMRLREEDLTYFSTNEYVITAAPILFMIGFGMLYGFRNKALSETRVLGMTLYHAVCYFINIVYYGMLNYAFTAIRRRDSGE